MSARDATPLDPATKTAIDRWPCLLRSLQRMPDCYRYPRTLAEAFPGTPEVIEEEHDVSARLDWRWCDALAAVLFVGVVAALAVGWI